MRIAYWITKATHTHTQNTQNCCFSTAIMITRMRLTALSVHAHYLSCNITLTPKRGSSKWSVSLRSTHKNPARTYLVSHTCHMHCPSQSSFLYHPWIFVPMTSNITYTSSEKVSVSGSQRSHTSNISSKSQLYGLTSVI